MPKYPPQGHPLLSAAARALDDPALDAQADIAEMLLRRGSVSLADTAFQAATSQFAQASLAVVVQVNFQVEAGVESEVYGSSSRGARSVSYRGGSSGSMPRVSAKAQDIVDVLIPFSVDAGEWPTVGSLR